jgi:hypothetical protein
VSPADVRRSRLTLALLRCAVEDVPPAPEPAPELRPWLSTLR